MSVKLEEIDLIHSHGNDVFQMEFHQIKDQTFNKSHMKLHESRTFCSPIHRGNNRKIIEE